MDSKTFRLALQHAQMKSDADLKSLEDRMNLKIKELEDKIQQRTTDSKPKTDAIPHPQPAMIASIGECVGLDMKYYYGQIARYKDQDLLIFKSSPRTHSIYTLNLRTLRPTNASPIQKHLTRELVDAINAASSA